MLESTPFTFANLRGVELHKSSVIVRLERSVRCVDVNKVTDKTQRCFIGPCKKSNTIQIDTPKGRVIVKVVSKAEFDNERQFYVKHSKLSAVCNHIFHIFSYSGIDTYLVIRFDCTEYTVLDLCYAYRTADFSKLKEIFLKTGLYSEDEFVENWYDSILQKEVYHKIFTRLAPLLLNILECTAQFADSIVATGDTCVLTLDNQNINGKWLDFGDFSSLGQPLIGIPILDTYYSYMLPLLGASQCFYNQLDITLVQNEYDYTKCKLALYEHYFRWHLTYHPNIVDCIDDMCVLTCSNFNVLLGMGIPWNLFGPLVSIDFLHGQQVPVCSGFHSLELGIILNEKPLPTEHLLRAAIVYGTPLLHTTTAIPTIDTRTQIPCVGSGKLISGKVTRPAFIDFEFYEFAKDALFFDGSSINQQHFYFLHPQDSTMEDFNYYRFNIPTVVDICQFKFVFSVTEHYFSMYSATCLKSEFVVVNNPNKSSGFPFNQLGNAGDIYSYLGHERIDELFNYSKSAIVPTITKVIVKSAISAKDRCRTVSGVGILSTMMCRCMHQCLLKEIAATRDATVVIGTPKFYGGWHSMLSRFVDKYERELIGWDYPKCDRSMPNMLRLASAWLFICKHKCCNLHDRIFRLGNELSEVLTETCLVQGVYYSKPGGTSSGDATTAYANSVFNIFQVVTTAVNHCLQQDLPEHRPFNVKLYNSIYRLQDKEFVSEFYNWMQVKVPLMILSDDGVAGPIANDPQCLNLDSFKSTLFYQNNVVLTPDKCWRQRDISKGPHEFCSQHTIMHNGIFYPVPDPSRILAACMYTNSMEKSDPHLMCERFVSLAIDAYPLVYSNNETYRQVFPTILGYINKVVKDRDLNIYSLLGDYWDNSGASILSEAFYSKLYESSTIMQSVDNSCVICSSSTILSCATCVRRYPMCCSCLYYHVTETSHRALQSTKPFVCSVPGCDVSDCFLLSYSLSGDGALRCVNHTTDTVRLPLIDEKNKVVFAFGKDQCSYTPLIHKFNTSIERSFSDADDYDFYDYPLAAQLVIAELIKTTEERSKDGYKPGTVTSVYSSEGIHFCVVAWSGKVPPVNANSRFSAMSGRTSLGEFVLNRTSSGSYRYTYVSLAGIVLKVGVVLKLTSHNVARLTSPPIPVLHGQLLPLLINMVPLRYTSATQISFFFHVLQNYITTVQGPPGTGKSFLIAGLPEFFPSSRIMFVANSHAAVDAVCKKLFDFGMAAQSTRFKSNNSVHCTFSGFVFNDSTRRIICSTVNSVPSCSVDIVVVDEVSMCSIADLSFINSRVRARRYVYCGDPQQLSAPRTLCKTCIAPEKYNHVTRLMVQSGPSIFLDVCYRCPKEIVDVCSAKCYDNKLTAHNSTSGECWSILMPHGAKSSVGDTGFVNMAHVDIIKKYLLTHPNFRDAIFISPYHSMNSAVYNILGLQVATVDASQGCEYDYVIYSQTSTTAFACNLQRFNVAISRAKVGLLVVACTPDFNVFDPPPKPIAAVAQSATIKNNYLAFKGAERSVDYCTPEYAADNFTGCVALDMEFVHSHGQVTPTQYLFQVGLARKHTGTFVVHPCGFLKTPHGIVLNELKRFGTPGCEYHFAKGFTWQKKMLKRAVTMSLFIKNVLSFIAQNTLGRVIFVTWAPLGDVRQCPIFVRYGPEKQCSCGAPGVFFQSRF
nr:TPA_inf: RdRp [Blenny letovirus]